NRSILLSRVSQRTARSQLAQSASAARDARGAALLARSRCRWFSRRCHASSGQRHRISRQSAESRFRPGMSPYRELLTTYTVDLPEVQEIVAMMRAVIEEYDDRMRSPPDTVTSKGAGAIA